LAIIAKEEQKIRMTVLKNVRGMVFVKLKKIITQEYQTEKEKTTEKSRKNFYITTKSKQSSCLSARSPWRRN